MGPLILTSVRMCFFVASIFNATLLVYYAERNAIACTYRNVCVRMRELA